jgi:hypothetical protein
VREISHNCIGFQRAREYIITENIIIQFRVVGFFSKRHEWRRRNVFSEGEKRPRNLVEDSEYQDFENQE